MLAWGNLSRGDDALGPLFVDRVQRQAASVLEPAQEPYVECVLDFQLQVEYALDLVGRERVLFVDAARAGPEPFSATPLDAAWDPTYTTHELSPAALLHVCRTVLHTPPPPAWLLGIRGYRWELGEDPTPGALANLDAALVWFDRWLADASAPPLPAAVSRIGGGSLS